MTPTRRRPGYTLVAVLIVVVVLSLVAYRFTDAMTAEYAVAVRSSEAAEAKTLATSGVHYAAGMLSDPDTLTNRLGGNPYDNAGEFSNVTVTDATRPRSGGRFSLFAVADTGTGFGDTRYQVQHGVQDEQGKLNVNALIALDTTGQVLYDALMKLPNMTEDVADAIVDWVDTDDTTRTAGAETSYYTGQASPYAAKNGPLNSLDELLLVRGVTSQLLYGNDRNRNGRPDPGEDDGNEFSRGWSEYLTVYGREIDIDTTGNPRLMINPADPASADVNTLAADLTNALGQEMADYVLFYVLGGTVSQIRTTTTTTTVTADGGMVLTLKVQSTQSQNTSNTVTGTADQLRAAVQQMIDQGKTPSKKLNSVFTLYNSRATLPQPQNQQGQGGQQGGQGNQQGQGGQSQTPPTIVFPSPLNDPAKVKDLLPKLLDLTTPRTTFEIAPRVNVNTAPPEVLLALPGMTQQDVDAIVSGRTGLSPTDPATTTGAWIVTQANVPMDRFRNLEKYVTGRTMTYRVQSVGYFGQGGPVARVEAVIDTNQGHPRIVYFRDLTDLGRGFELPR